MWQRGLQLGCLHGRRNAGVRRGLRRLGAATGRASKCFLWRAAALLALVSFVCWGLSQRVFASRCIANCACRREGDRRGRTIVCVQHVAVAVFRRAAALEASGLLLGSGLRRAYQRSWTASQHRQIQHQTDGGGGCNEGASESLSGESQAAWARLCDLRRRAHATAREEGRTCCVEGRRVNGAVRVHDAVSNASIRHDLDGMHRVHSRRRKSDQARGRVCRASSGSQKGQWRRGGDVGGCAGLQVG